MARVRKPVPTLEGTFFSTPEQKVLKLLFTEPTTTFTPRVIASRLKGVRGVGGADGLGKILEDLSQLGFIDWVDNHRAVRLRDESRLVAMLKTLSAICDLESLTKQIEPLCSRGILFGSRASGRSRSDSDYDLFVVTDQPAEAERLAKSHPLGKGVEIVAWTQDAYDQIGRDDPALAAKLEAGILLWGATGGW